MKDEQFETLVNLINSTNEKTNARIDALDAKIDKTNEKTIKFVRNAISESETHLILMINELRRDMDKNMRTTSRQFQTLTDLIENRYTDLENRIDFHDEDIDTLHALSKLNDAKHKEYDRILAKNNIK